MTMFFDIGDSLGEFSHKMGQTVLKSLYDGLYEQCELAFNGIFASLNHDISQSSNLLTQSIQNWNASGFAMVKNIAETACIPVAGCIITIIFCWELIHMIQDGNSMKATSPEFFIFTMFKLCLCLLACSKSFNIVMGFYDLGAYVTEKVSSSSSGSFGVGGLNLTSLIPTPTGDYTVGMVMTMLSNFLLLKFGGLIIKVIGLVIFFRVNMWFLELLIYAAAAPIPFSTFMNKEWSQIGLNYTRKMLALGFQGFFMVVAFALYGAIMSNINGDFTRTLLMSIGCGCVLVLLLLRSGQIASSVFNAH